MRRPAVAWLPTVTTPAPPPRPTLSITAVNDDSVVSITGVAGTFMPSSEPAPPAVAPGALATAPSPDVVWQENGTSFGCLQARAEFLLWWVNDSPVAAPLVTGDRTNGMANPFTSGGLADPNTVVLFGNNEIDFGTFPGGRFAADLQVTSNLRVEGTGFFLGQQSADFTFLSNAAGSPVLFRPIITAANGDQEILTSLFGPPLIVPIAALLPAGGSANAGNLAAFPANFSGGVGIASSLELWGAEANLVTDLVRENWIRFSCLAGFRFLNLHESLHIGDRGTLLPDPNNPDDAFGFASFLGFLIHDGAAGDTITTFDSFRTANRFYGGQLGVGGEFRQGPWLIGGSGKIGLGTTDQVLRLDGGSSLVTAEGLVTNAPGGVLVPPFNIGSHRHSEFSVVPELRIDLGYEFQAGCRVYVGYDFLYWSSVARPGEQISVFVNDTQNPASPRFNQAGQVVGVRAPGVFLDQSAFFAHGLHFGLQLAY
jgi:hypothetical protein